MLGGVIPVSLVMNCSNLEIIDISTNKLTGKLPNEIGFQVKLVRIYAETNNLTGDIPPTIGNLSSLETFWGSHNNLVGQIPDDVGRLKRLLFFHIIANGLSTSLCNASKLQIISIPNNNFEGQVPTNFGNLQELWWLDIALNNLGSNSSNDLDFIRSLRNCSKLEKLAFNQNHLGGVLPNSIANLSAQLDFLLLGDNQVSGNIDGAIFENLISLIALGLEGNLLTGIIPTCFGNLTKLATLTLENNNLEGTIPPSLGNCQRLQYLDLSQNKFFGAIPHQVLRLSSLSQMLNLSKNSMNGSLPAELGPGKPFLVGEFLPRNSTFIFGFFKISSGEVPKSGAFGNASAISLTGNAKLCGGVSTLKLPTCPIKPSKQGKKNNFKMIIAIVSVAMSFLVLATFVIVYWRRKSTYKSTSMLSILESLPKVSYRRLYEATEGFSPSNLIGSGGFDSIYKGVLDQGQSVAVKVLILQQIGASKSFITECNALRNIRHRNLIKIITCCSSTDYNQNEFKALIFEFMTNGSLEKWLYPDTEGENQPRNLSLIERLNVAKDVASALHYLHDQCKTTILDCDIKPSNVLLHNEMVAHLGDFGLARLLLAADNSSQTQSSTVGMMGTIGYVCPGKKSQL
ncbi:hypothetical protein FNV43_RR05769 [Rhamnella rubrinervis]|uniref:Protein kinase domain-containing protein n=1 Tax=Rhamnella rubrinervis TaxID=2594499 RepID=A0A8K0HMP6_9ROSA|nr:hypothetical protein FNV43_RR05769 [Rhamnella rubrinervis]